MGESNGAGAFGSQPNAEPSDGLIGDAPAS